MDECHAAGGYVEMKSDQYENGWSEWPECIVEDCGEFQVTNGVGTEWENTWCDRGCMLTGGELHHHVDEEYGYDWSECYYGEDMEMCQFLVEDGGHRYCDSYCAPNNGVLIDGRCVYDNIDDEYQK